MTTNTLAAIRERANKRTRGAWFSHEPHDSRDIEIICDTSPMGSDMEAEFESIGFVYEAEDGEFIAHAPADIAALLAIVDGLTARAEAAEAALRELVSDTAAADREPNHWMKESAQAGVTSDEFATYCVYCRSNDEDYKQITHAPECPIARGQALLALAAHDANGESAGNGGA